MDPPESKNIENTSKGKPKRKNRKPVTKSRYEDQTSAEAGKNATGIRSEKS